MTAAFPSALSCHPVSSYPWFMTVHTSLPQCSLMSPSVLMIHDCSHQPSPVLSHVTQCPNDSWLFTPALPVLSHVTQCPNDSWLFTPGFPVLSRVTQCPNDSWLVLYTSLPQCSLLSPSVLMIHDCSHQPSPVLSHVTQCPNGSWLSTPALPVLSHVSQCRNGSWLFTPALPSALSCLPVSS